MIGVFVTPPSFTVNFTSPSNVTLANKISEPLTVKLRSPSAPRVIPESVAMPIVPDVVSFVSDLKNCSELILSNKSALVAVPSYLNSVESPESCMLSPGLNVASP